MAAVRAILTSGPPDSGMLRTALQLAARGGHAPLVELLLDAGAEPGDDALIEAAARGADSLLRALLARGVNGGCDEALIIAAERGKLAAVRTLLAAGAGSLDSALKGAIEAHDAPVVAALVDAGAHAAEGLCHAALIGDAALVELFIERGATNLDQAFLIGAKANQKDALNALIVHRAMESETQTPLKRHSTASSAVAAHLALNGQMAVLSASPTRDDTKKAPFHMTVRAPGSKSFKHGLSATVVRPSMA